YTYDHAGNLISDQQENISSVKWNIYGKIESIVKPGVSTITYGYDAHGNRINKTVADVASNTTTTTHYVLDPQGITLGVYSYSFTGTSTTPNEGDWIEQDLYGASRLGAINPNVRITPGSPLGADDYTSNSAIGPVHGLQGLRTYELTNHLGNVVTTISDKKISIPSQTNSSLTDHYEADVLTQQDYYPFGMVMPGRSYAATGVGGYRYGVNGKENDNEV